MTAGVIRLGAYGREDLYLSVNPQVTFFKAVYRRHTFFTMEAIEQNFITRPDFGGTYSSILSAHGDLINDMTLQIALPSITPSASLLYRWVADVAAAAVKKVELEINGVVVDTITGEWIRISQELTGSRKRPLSDGSHKRGLAEMMGPLGEFSESIPGHTVYLHLPLWFSRSSGQAFPIASINTHEVRVNVEFNTVDALLQYGPTHSISVAEPSVYFRQGAYICQGNRDTPSAMGIYFGYTGDAITYNPVYGAFTAYAGDDPYYNPDQAFIRDARSTFCTPTADATDLGAATAYKLRQMFHLGTATTILTQYVFLGGEEKKYFAEKRHDYVIEQLQTQVITNLRPRQSIRLLLRRPCKEIVWIAKLQQAAPAAGTPFLYGADPRGRHVPILRSSILTMNSMIVWSDDNDGNLQMFMHHPSARDRLPGIHTYSFAVDPDEVQPSGSVNMSHIERIYLDVVLAADLPDDDITLIAYARTYNVLAVEKGVARLLF